MSDNKRHEKMEDEEVEGETVGGSAVVSVVLETSSEKLMKYINEKFVLMKQPPAKYTVTKNGAICLSTSGSALLDFFSKCGAMRNKTEMLHRYFLLALAENPSYTMKCIFYMRDVRGGQGERECFRSIMKFLAEDDVLRKFALRNMKYINDFGRYDDLVYAFSETPLQDEMIKIVKSQLEKDIVSERPSLLGKWLPSENTSSSNTKKHAKILIKEMGYTPKQYRKKLTLLRKKTCVLETNMSKKDYESIQYDRVPSMAFKKYNRAFVKNDEERFKKFLEDVKKGEKKIKAGAIFPYDIIKKFLVNPDQLTPVEVDALSLQWENLPEYLPEGENCICVVDTSGSMFSGCASVKPICVAISLGIYIGERCSMNGFITFSENPTFQRITGNSLKQKVDNMKRAEWAMSTNIQSVFDLILSMQMRDRNFDNPITKIFIISDMQFNIADRNISGSNFDVIDEKYKKAGFKRPKLVFWNVNASDGCEVGKNTPDTFLISGCSPSLLHTALTNDPFSYMMKVLNKDRYKNIY